MHPVIRDQIDRIGDQLALVCGRRKVAKLEIFGSAATGAFDPQRSDLDFLVTFESDYFPGIADAFAGLGEDLEALFERPVDLVTRRSVKNPYLEESIERSASTLYESTSE